MKETPILFNDAMAAAVRDNRKTQTRRIITANAGCDYHAYPGSWILDGGRWQYQSVHGVSEKIRCRYGQVGDRLWVREGSICLGTALRGENGQLKWPKLSAAAGREWFAENCRYTSDIIDGGLLNMQVTASNCGLNKMFMPHWASRTTLEITDVRAERIQQMSYVDWIADFCPSFHEREQALATFTGSKNQREMAKAFWDSINKSRGFGWDVNPWVFAISFNRV
jgi:hypothetical protein